MGVIAVQAVEGQCLPSLQTVYTKAQFFKDVKDKNEEEIVQYLASHHLQFLQQGDAIKIRKHTKSDGEALGDDRSSILTRSVTILSDGTAFHDMHDEGLSDLGKSIPDVLGKGVYKRVSKIRRFDKVAVAVAQTLVKPDEVEKEFNMTQKIDPNYILRVDCYGIRGKETHKKGYSVSALCQGSLCDLYRNDHPKFLQTHASSILNHFQRALVACHKAKITHQDAHVGNIFWDVSGRFRLGDFGKAKPFHNALNLKDNTSVDSVYLQRLHALVRAYIPRNPNQLTVPKPNESSEASRQE